MRTTTIKLDGDTFAAKTLADMEVNRLLEIFRKQTSFQNLQQNKQMVNLVGGPFDGAHVTLTTQFGIETVDVFVPPRVVPPRPSGEAPRRGKKRLRWTEKPTRAERWVLPAILVEWKQRTEGSTSLLDRMWYFVFESGRFNQIDQYSLWPLLADETRPTSADAWYIPDRRTPLDPCVRGNGSGLYPFGDEFLGIQNTDSTLHLYAFAKLKQIGVRPPGKYLNTLMLPQWMHPYGDARDERRTRAGFTGQIRNDTGGEITEEGNKYGMLYATGYVADAYGHLGQNYAYYPLVCDGGTCIVVAADDAPVPYPPGAITYTTNDDCRTPIDLDGALQYAIAMSYGGWTQEDGLPPNGTGSDWPVVAPAGMDETDYLESFIYAAMAGVTTEGVTNRLMEYNSTDAKFVFYHKQYMVDVDSLVASADYFFPTDSLVYSDGNVTVGMAGSREVSSEEYPYDLIDPGEHYYLYCNKENGPAEVYKIKQDADGAMCREDGSLLLRDGVKLIMKYNLTYLVYKTNFLDGTFIEYEGPDEPTDA